MKVDLNIAKSNIYLSPFHTFTLFFFSMQHCPLLQSLDLWRARTVSTESLIMVCVCVCVFDLWGERKKRKKKVTKERGKEKREREREGDLLFIENSVALFRVTHIRGG